MTLPIDLTLTDEEYRLLDSMFRGGDRGEDWVDQMHWREIIPIMAERKLIFRYVINNGVGYWSLSNYGCDAVRAHKAAQVTP